MQLAAQSAPIPHRHVETSRHKVSEIGKRTQRAISSNRTSQRERISLNAVIHVEGQRRQKCGLGSEDINVCLSRTLQRHPQCGVSLCRHALYFYKRRQCRARLEIVDDCEILIQRWEQQHGQVKARIVHGKFAFLETLLLLAILNLRLDYVRMRCLAELLLVLRNFIEVFRLIQALLGRGVPVLGNRQRVVKLRNSHRKASAGNFSFRSADRFNSFRAMIGRHRIILRRQILMQHTPRAIYMNAIIRDESPVRCLSVALCQEGLSRCANGWQQRISSLHPVFMGNLRIGAGRKKLRIILASPCDCV